MYWPRTEQSSRRRQLIRKRYFRFQDELTQPNQLVSKTFALTINGAKERVRDIGGDSNRHLPTTAATKQHRYIRLLVGLFTNRLDIRQRRVEETIAVFLAESVLLFRNPYQTEIRGAFRTSFEC